MTKIVLVEDDEFLIDVYKAKLEKENFEVEVVKEGDKAVEKIKTTKPAIVLLDIVLPNLDGWGILKNLKNDPETKDIPVIVLSNLAQEEEIQKSMQLGAAKYLVKAQYIPSEIAQEIKKILS